MIMILNKIRDDQNYASSIMAIVIVIMITSVVKIIHYDLDPHNHRDFKTRCSLKAEQDSLTWERKSGAMASEAGKVLWSLKSWLLV